MADAMKPLTMTPEREAALRDNSAPVVWYSTPGMVDAVFAELDATRASLAECEAKLAQAEAQRDAAAADYTVARTDAMAAESRVAALLVTLTDIGWGKEFAPSDEAPSVDESLARCRQIARSAVRAAALSPSQDAKTGGDV